MSKILACKALLVINVCGRMREKARLSNERRQTAVRPKKS